MRTNPVATNRNLIVSGLLAGLVTAATVFIPARAEQSPDGRALAERLCGDCHAIAASDQSAHADALPFRSIARRYSVWNLQEALAEGIMVGHEDMPEFTLTPDQIEALLSYMETLGPDKSE